MPRMKRAPVQEDRAIDDDENEEQKQHQQSNSGKGKGQNFDDPIVASTAPATATTVRKSKRRKENAGNDSARSSVIHQTALQIDPTADRLEDLNSPNYQIQLRRLEARNKEHLMKQQREREGLASQMHTSGPTPQVDIQEAENMQVYVNSTPSTFQNKQRIKSSPAATASGSKNNASTVAALSSTVTPEQWRFELCKTLGIADSVDDGALLNLLQETMEKSQKYDALH